MQIKLIPKKLYIYTKRRARVNNISQYVELIPKLFNDLYGIDNKINIHTLMQKYKTKDNTELFNSLLNDQSNELHKAKYISDRDKQEIININKELFNSITESNFLNLITHLYRSHDTQYGIYFSIMYATNDIDFISNFKRSNRPTSEDRIILYTTLDNFLLEIEKINNQKKFEASTKILYLNS
jgi:hypothetical protein